jgi:hypothetical protein
MNGFYKKLIVSAVLFFGLASRARAVDFINPLTGKPGNGNESFDTLTTGILNFIFGLALIVCPALIVWGGFLYATSGGEEEKIKKGRRLITYAVVGLIVIGASQVIKAIILDIVNTK